MILFNATINPLIDKGKKYREYLLETNNVYGIDLTYN